MINIGVLISGSGTNLQSIIDAIGSGKLDAEIKLVLSDRPEATGLERARSLGIPAEVHNPKGISSREDYDARAVALLKEHGVELVVLAGFMRLVSPVFLNAFPMKVLNIHPSLLPAFPGLDVQRKALEHGVKFSGCTVHIVDEGLDSGPIVIQAVVPVLDGDGVEELRERILAREHVIYPLAIGLFSAGRVRVEGRRVLIEGSAGCEGFLINPAPEVSE